jgi:hypothetical protein
MTLTRRLLHGVSLLLLSVSALAEEVYELRIRDHLFQPSRLEVPAGRKLRIRVINEDASPEEFDSFSLNREKVILGRSKAMLYVGPLEPGEYPFSGDYHPDSATGMLVAVPSAISDEGVTHAD